MPDPNNWLTEEEKRESQQRLDERLATIKTSTAAACSDNLKTVWLQGKLANDVDSNARAFGNRNLQDLAADLHMTESNLRWRMQLHLQYDENDLEEFAKKGLGWTDIYALLHFRDFEERESALERLVAKKIDWRVALEEAGRAEAREKVRRRKELDLEYERKNRENLEKNPASFIRVVFESAVSRMSDTMNMLERVWMAYMKYREAIDKMGYFHRLIILTHRQACVEVIQYYSRQFADLANHIAQRVPELLPDAKFQEPIPPLPASTNLWRDLHECKLQMPSKKLGKGYTTIRKTMENFTRTNPKLDERLSAVDWAIDQFLKMPDDLEGKVMCRQRLVAVHTALCTSQRMFAERRAKLAQ